MSKLLATICNSVERASCVAVELKKFLCSSMIETKDGKVKNVHANTDFKTFADVLIQQIVTRDIERSFQQLKGRVFGEESDKININGVNIHVSLASSDDETSQTSEMLSSVLESNSQLVSQLTNIIHRQAQFHQECWQPNDFPNFELDLSDVAFWIDPIDCTNQYILAAIEGTFQSI